MMSNREKLELEKAALTLRLANIDRALSGAAVIVEVYDKETGQKIHEGCGSSVEDCELHAAENWGKAKYYWKVIA